MNFSRHLLAIAAALFCAGCATTPSGRYDYPYHYRRVTVSDLSGRLVAEWIAEGNVWRRGRGYRFRAVQRTSGPPYMTVSRYPLGRKVEIGGPNITVAPCGKPEWLYEIDAPYRR